MGQYFRAVILNQEENTIKCVFSPYESKCGANLYDFCYIDNPFVEEVEIFLLNNTNRLVFAGDYAKEEPNGFTLYEMTIYYEPTKPRKSFSPDELNEAYVINHDKHQFYKRPQFVKGAWQINPLVMLTYEGSDIRYGGTGDEFIGTWSRDNIEVSFTKPNDSYEEISPYFI